MLESLKDFFWPSTCIPTKIYVIISILNLLTILILLAMCLRRCRNLKNNELSTSIDKLRSLVVNKILMLSLATLLVSVLINVLIFNLMCGSGSNGSQILSGFFGFFLISPIIAMLVFSLMVAVFLNKAENDLLFKRDTNSEMM